MTCFRELLFSCRKGCDRLITGSSGNITSPGYPSHYPNNARCTYKINAPKGSIIQLGFTFFHLTGYGDMDRFKIYEGIDESGLLTDSRRWGINYPYLSTGNNLMLVFTTDSFGTANGFSIRFTTVQGEIAFSKQLSRKQLAICANTDTHKHRHEHRHTYMHTRTCSHTQTRRGHAADTPQTRRRHAADTKHTEDTKHTTFNKHQTPNTKHQTPNTKHQTPNTT